MKKKDGYYKKNKVLKTALAGFDDQPRKKVLDEYHRSDEKRLLHEALEEIEEEQE